MKETENNIETRIIETARQLFCENGYKKTSMSDIAQAVGINRPTLHYYYRTKDKLFEAVFSLLIQSFVPKIELISTTDIPFEEKIEKIIDEYISIFSANPFLPQFVLGEIQRDPDHLLAVMQKLHFDNYFSLLKKMFSDEVEKGNVKPVQPPILFLTFLSQITFPFLSKNILLRAFVKDEEGFLNLIQEWKIYVIKQMKSLLIN